jgi:hypothetical protein
MEPNPTPPPKKPALMWPVGVNLLLLLAAAVYARGNAAFISSAIAALVVVNLFAALLLAFFSRMHWVVAFVLSAVLLPLIGLGLCAVIISMNGGLGGGH